MSVYVLNRVDTKGIKSEQKICENILNYCRQSFGLFVLNNT